MCGQQQQQQQYMQRLGNDDSHMNLLQQFNQQHQLDDQIAGTYDDGIHQSTGILESGSEDILQQQQYLCNVSEITAATTGASTLVSRVPGKISKLK